MTLNDLLRGQGIDPKQVLVLRHTPRATELKLKEEFPRLAAAEPKLGLFNAYQQAQTKDVELEMKSAKYIASFIGYQKPAKTVFVGLYSNDSRKSISRDEYWKIPANVELKKLGMKGFTDQDSRPEILWFDLKLTPICENLKGKLLVQWSQPYVRWDRWAHEWDTPILKILKKNVLGDPTPDWNSVDLGAEELGIPATPTPLNADDADESPERVITTSYRILRDTDMTRKVKQLHNYQCQVCGKTMVLHDGSRYAEAHHIRPLGRQHNGPDRQENILCLCPNHHAELDYGVREISVGSLRSVDGHVVGEEFIDYHNRRVSELRATNKE